MKFDRSKTFPYPVLRPYSDDYTDVEFQALAEFTIEQSGMGVTCTYVTSSDELAAQVSLGNAKYVTVISCRETYFRKVISTSERSITLPLDPDVLRGEVDVDSYIVAVQEINGFSSPDIHKEFGKDVFFFEPGQVLAQEETHCIFVDRELFKPLSSVFDLVKNDALSGGEWRASLDDEHVKIEVSATMKESIDNSRSSSLSKSVLINSIYFSAVVHAIQRMKDGDEFGEAKWAKVIRRQLHNHHLDLETVDAYILAQKLMKHPLGVLNTYVFAKAAND
jgi:hypothetical protein